MPKVPPGSCCEADAGSVGGLGDGAGTGEANEGSADGLGDGAGAEEASNSPDGTSSGRDSDDGVVGMGLLKKGNRALTLSQIDILCFDIADEAIARRR